MRYYKLPKDKMDKLISKTLEDLLNSSAGKITLDLDKLTALPKPKKKAVITFSEDSWLKITTLISASAIELAWHCVVHEIAPHEYYVSEVLVYPQIVGPATVDSDDDGYAQWRDDLTDEQYNNLRFQGHSHVNYGIDPSPKDLTYYDTLTKHIKNFYIFMIMNKKGDIFINIIDVKNNLVYESTDVTVLYEQDGFNYAAWYKAESEKYFSTKKVPPVTTPTIKNEKYGDYDQDSIDVFDSYIRRHY